MNARFLSLQLTTSDIFLLLVWLLEWQECNSFLGLIFWVPRGIELQLGAQDIKLVPSFSWQYFCDGLTRKLYYTFRLHDTNSSIYSTSPTWSYMIWSWLIWLVGQKEVDWVWNLQLSLLVNNSNLPVIHNQQADMCFHTVQPLVCAKSAPEKVMDSLQGKHVSITFLVLRLPALKHLPNVALFKSCEFSLWLWVFCRLRWIPQSLNC